VQYSDDPAPANMRKLTHEISRRVTAPINATAAVLDLPLEKVRAGQSITMLIERQSFADDDNLQTSLRLITAALINPEGDSR